MDKMEPDKLLNAFYLITPDFGKNVDSLAMVTENTLTVFNNENKRPRLVFEGLNIRGCVQVH